MSNRRISVAKRSAVSAGLAAVLSFTAWAGPLFAANVDDLGPINEVDHNAKPTEQSMAFEFRLGPYLPELPNTRNNTPSFGDELVRSHRVMMGVEVDWQALRLPKILNIGPGFGTAYTKMANDGTYNSGSQPLPYSATLKIWTQWVEAVLRVDILQQKYGLPFVFTGKLGAARATWWSQERRPESSSQNQKNSGSAQGLAWAVGAMLDLGFLEPERARYMDVVSGVNHMYLFWEWYQLRLDDFGRGTNQLGDSTWALGWAADM